MTSGFIIMALQTAFNTKQPSTVNQHQKTVQSIRLFWAQQYNRIIVDYKNCKIMMMSWRYCWIITSYWYLSLRKTLWLCSLLLRLWKCKPVCSSMAISILLNKYICEYLTGIFEHVWQAAILVKSKRRLYPYWESQFGTGLFGHI